MRERSLMPFLPLTDDILAEITTNNTRFNTVSETPIDAMLSTLHVFFARVLEFCVMSLSFGSWYVELRVCCLIGAVFSRV